MIRRLGEMRKEAQEEENNDEASGQEGEDSL